MAMFENLGHCPNNGFGFNLPEDPAENPLWPATRELLGDRTGYMYYPKDDKNSAGEEIRTTIPSGWDCRSGHCSIVDVLRFGTGTVGIELATVLRTFMPECRYARWGRPIMCYDVDRDELPVALQLMVHGGAGYGVRDFYQFVENREHMVDRRLQPGVAIVQDDYHVVVAVNTEKAVELYIWSSRDSRRLNAFTDGLSVELGADQKRETA